MTDLKTLHAFKEVEEELLEATKNYGPMKSEHEGYAILLEEVEELWGEIKKKPKNRDHKKLRAEARQVSAMALRIMIDLT